MLVSSLFVQLYSLALSVFQFSDGLGIHFIWICFLNYHELSNIHINARYSVAYDVDEYTVVHHYCFVYINIV